MKDSTTRMEELIEEAADVGVSRFRELGPEVQSRPLGSVRVRPQDALFDYVNRDASYWPKMFQAHTERGLEPTAAMAEMAHHDTEMRKLQEKSNAEPY